MSAASGVQLWTAEPSDGEGKPCRLFGALAADEIAAAKASLSSPAT
jgi:hypothetical protein